jgi:hypothetical protein
VGRGIKRLAGGRVAEPGLFERAVELSHVVEQCGGGEMNPLLVAGG